MPHNPRHARDGKQKASQLHCQRIVVLVLVVANAILCVVTLLCLQRWGDKESLRNSHRVLDLSDIGAAPLFIRSKFEPRLQDIYNASVGFLPRPLAKSEAHRMDSSSTSSSRTPVRAASTNGLATAEGMRNYIYDSCAYCGSMTEDPLPTTRQTRSTDVHCTWTLHANTVLADFAADATQQYNLDDAKHLCLELGDKCGGVTCSSDVTCSLRAEQPLSLATQRETTYKKTCTTNRLCPSQSPPQSRPEIRTKQASHFSDELQGVGLFVLAHNRRENLQTCLESLLKAKESALFHLHVSIDDPEAFNSMNGTVYRIATAYNVKITVWNVPPIVVGQSSQSYNGEQLKFLKMNVGKIAHHYWFALEKAFTELKYNYAIFLEEDLIAAPDFFALFRSTFWLLKEDSSLWCVSAWNDFGNVMSATDQCRLLRTGYFPGLGFLLPQHAWHKLRSQWPLTPTMGWDYWMRVGFRREGKECIIPEVSRTKHASEKGSSITTKKQLLLLSQMAFASRPSSCSTLQPCHHFGDISYMLLDSYDRLMAKAIANSPRRYLPQLATSSDYDRRMLYVVPYERTDFAKIGLPEKFGLIPQGTARAIPNDVRTEHHGIVMGRHPASLARILLVDKMSAQHYLRLSERMPLLRSTISVPGIQGQSCDEACASKHMKCDASQLEYFNNCHALEKHFKCEAGCAHQVGNELPVYVPDSFQPTHQQCLVTFISKLDCKAKHKSTSRLCACVPIQ